MDAPAGGARVTRDTAGARAAAPSSLLTRTLTGRGVWHGAELAGGPRDWVWQLAPDTLADIDRALDAVKRSGKALTAVTREDFALPSLSAEFARIADELENGRGFAQIRGLDARRYDADDLALIFWGVSTHLGRAISQNAQGDLLGHVRDEGRDMADGRTRLYQTNLRQRFHTDIGADVVGLCCVRPAREGGVSMIASSAAIHNALLERAPWYLGALYNRFKLDWRGEQPAGEPGWYSEPVFAWHEGRLSCRFSATLIDSAQRLTGEPLTAVQREALAMVEALAEEFSLCVDFAPGDLQYISNYMVLHDRSAFVDDPAWRRHLYRIWLTTPGARSLPPQWSRSTVRGGIAARAPS